MPQVLDVANNSLLLNRLTILHSLCLRTMPICDSLYAAWCRRFYILKMGSFEPILLLFTTRLEKCKAR